MKGIQLTKRAVDDLRSIGRYTQQNWGREQRNKYLHKLNQGFLLIGNDPLIGADCDFIRKGYRKFHVGKHLIFYRITDNHVQIIRILHERMNIDNHLK